PFVPDWTGQRDRQSDRAGHQAHRQPDHCRHHARAHRPRLLRAAASRVHPHPGRRRADGDLRPDDQRPADLRRADGTPRVLADPALPQRMTDGIYIGGEWRPGSRGTVAVRNPADGSVVDEIGYGGAAEAAAAIDAAAAAFNPWAEQPARARSDILQRV